MGGIYHKGKPYSGQMVVDTDLSKVSNNPLKNRAITGLIDDVIAPVEGANASQAYAAGDELILNNLLYKANQAITQGTAFDAESGGNIELAGSIVSQLKSLFANEDLLKKVGTISDLNSPNTTPGVRFYSYPWSATGAPKQQSGGYLLNMASYNNEFCQVAIELYDLSVFVRKYSSNTWTAWKQIYGNTILTGTNMISGAMSGNGTQYTLGKITGMSKGVYVTVFKCSAYLTSGSSGDALFAVLGGRVHLFSSSTSSLPIGIETTYLLNVTSDNYTWEPSGTFYGSGSYTISGTPSLTAIKVA